MTEFEEILKEEFLKFSPSMLLSAGEIVAIKMSVIRLLKQKRSRNEELLTHKGTEGWRQNLRAGIWIIDEFLEELEV